MNTIEYKTKEIASWQCPDQYIPTDAVIAPNDEILLMNSSEYYYSMSPSNPDLVKHTASKELLRIEEMGNENYLVLTYEEGSYICYKTNSPSLEGAEVIDLGSDAVEIAYNEQNNSIYFVNTSKELRSYNLNTKEHKILSDISSKSVFLSSNNKYIAFEGIGDESYVGTIGGTNPEKYVSKNNSELLGVTDEGALVLLELSVAEKNSSTSATELVMIKGTDRKVLVSSCDYNWAILQGTRIVASNSKGKITFFELLNN